MSACITTLIKSLAKLPGIGPKSAQRITYNLLERNQDVATGLATALNDAVKKVGHCEKCRTLTENTLCNICANPKRDSSILCIVETPADILAIEQAHNYQGLYFVLMGHLSPLDGIGPNELGISDLQTRIDRQNLQEIIVATNPTIEGEATAHYISGLITAKHITCTRIAHGVPMGGELEYLDGNTLSRAFAGRQVFAQGDVDA